MASDTVTSRQYIAIPFRADFDNPASERKNAAIFNGLLSLPIFPLPGTEDQRKFVIAALLTDPNNLVWECWEGGTLIGVMMLDRVIPFLEGRAHFAYFDRQLWGRRDLVRNTMAWCFEYLGLQRMDVEIPVTLDALIRFTRVKLGFRYPGETEAAQHPAVQKMEEKLRINNPSNWVAKWGARKENAHWDTNEGKFVDVVCLRILRSEFEQSRREEAERVALKAAPAVAEVAVA